MTAFINSDISGDNSPASKEFKHDPDPESPSPTEVSVEDDGHTPDHINLQDDDNNITYHLQVRQGQCQEDR